ncbi:unnamed protein product [Moneuplotes crassus]|uniref:Uncharacterized protein n=1 Tax=Euplotes crassus TaxID=5936 RepID=A0AAD1Y6K2_EUPCR|nr:unnamed protein product [Moneuplotes crassus]
MKPNHGTNNSYESKGKDRQKGEKKKELKMIKAPKFSSGSKGSEFTSPQRCGQANYGEHQSSEGSFHNNFISQPSHRENAESSRLNINFPGKLSSKLQHRVRDSRGSKESELSYLNNGNFGFEVGRRDKPFRKNKKEQLSNSRKTLKSIEASTRKDKTKPTRKDEFSPKTNLKSLRVQRNSSSRKKIYMKDIENNNGLSRKDSKGSERKENKNYIERKKIHINTSSPIPSQVLNPKDTDSSSIYRLNVTNQAKKPFNNRFGSPGLLQKKKETEKANTGIKFMGEMKKHGIKDALDDMNKLAGFFQYKSSPKEEDFKNSAICNNPNDKSTNSEYFTQSTSHHMASPNDFMNSDSKNTVGSGIVAGKRAFFGSEENVDEEDPSKFLFPFQRRARSHSPPSSAEVQTKIAETIHNNRERERSWSKSAENSKNIPVIAKTSFIIGGINSGKIRKLGNRGRKAYKDTRVRRTQEPPQWFENNSSSSSSEYENPVVSASIELDDFLDENEIINQVTNSFNKNKGSANQGLKNEASSNIEEIDDWMYQTVGAFEKSFSKGNKECTKENNKDDQNINKMINQRANESKAKGYENKVDKVLEDLTFSMEEKEEIDYNDLETYIKKCNNNPVYH